MQQPPNIQGTQDSLSFSPINAVGQLWVSNSKLKDWIGALVEQYYQWKLACILAIDKNRQMAMEYKKLTTST
jgi:hypothetical protein